MDTFHYGLLQPFKGLGGCEWFDRHKKHIGEVYLHFQLELNALGVLSVLIDKNLKD
jgi:hypothetical protein